MDTRPVIAAILARKSTDQPGVPDEERSVTRQVEQARAYAAGKGWIVDERYIFVDALPRTPYGKVEKPKLREMLTVSS